MRGRIYRYNASANIIFCVLVLGLLATTSFSAQIFIGEPLGEALFDLSRDSVLVADSLSGGSPLKRTDVFKLRDGRLLAITSISERKGQPFSIIDLKATASAQTPLNSETPSTAKVELPER